MVGGSPHAPVQQGCDPGSDRQDASASEVDSDGEEFWYECTTTKKILDIMDQETAFTMRGHVENLGSVELDDCEQRAEERGLAHECARHGE